MSQPENSIAPGPAQDNREALEIPNLAQETNERVSKRTIGLAVGGACLAVAVAAGVTWKLGKRQAERETANREAAERTAAAMATRQFDPGSLAPPAPKTVPPAGSPPPNYQVPPIKQQPNDGIDPIRVMDDNHRGNRSSAPRQGKPVIDPVDAPMLLAPSRTRAGGIASDSPATQITAAAPSQDDLAQAKAQLQERQRELRNTAQMVRERLAAPTPGAANGMLPMQFTGPAPGAGLPQAPRGMGTPPQAGTAPAPTDTSERASGGLVVARQLPDNSLVMPMGTTFTCSLATRVVSAVAGHVSCITSRAVYGADNRVVLLEKGSKLEGEYKMVNVRPGMTRIPVLWTRVRTPPPNSVVVDLDSPATGPLGETGLGGYVDNRWGERLGAALLLSLIDDAVKIVIADKQETGSGTVVFGTGTAQTGSKLAEQVLAATINIPPLLTANQGDTVGVYVKHDVDFRSVYALRPTSTGR
ncbi:TrbI/VirB10 family protein [Azohydromonas lata]|uniref:TrbI/VirB10 family protein n=1 Tax=Azohydromonas lata TaxID=45677 RepID=UPI0012F5149E|nr:TrbI/VirB10 family protein [Azohydromonas lata]